MAGKVLRNDNGDLRELTDGQLAYAAYLILKDFASTSTGIGTVNVSSDPAYGTTIGTFIDTTRSVPVGTHPVDGTEINSTTYTFKQNLGTADTSSVVRPVSYYRPDDAVTSYTITSSEYEVLGLYDSSSNTVDDSDTGGDDVTLQVTINYDATNYLGYSVDVDSSDSGTTWEYSKQYMVKILGSELGGDDGVNDLYFLMSRYTGPNQPGQVNRLVVSNYTGFESQTPQIRNFDIKEMDDNQLRATLIGKCLTSLTTLGVGSYVLQPTAPSVGTWTEITTIDNDTLIGTNSTKLWRKTDGSEPTDVKRPLKLNNNYDIQEMSDAEISALSTVLRKQIVDTGIGTYKISASVPSGGTWVRVGEAFKDTRQKIGSQSFTLAGGYVGDAYTTNYDKAYVATYEGLTYDKFYAGTYYEGSYVSDQNIASYDKIYTGNYVRVTRTASYTGVYQRNVGKDYTGSRSYTRTFGSRQGSTYTGAYKFTGYYSRNFAGSYTRAFSTGFSGDYTRTYQRTSAVEYVGAYLRSSKTLNYVGSYDQDYVASYDQSYDANFIGTYSGDTILSQTEDVSEISLWIRTA
jgi:hypothetical protein